MKTLRILFILLLNSFLIQAQDPNFQADPTGATIHFPFRSFSQPSFSPDAGNPWLPTGPFGGDVLDLTADPLNPDHLFAAAGLPFFSDNNGVNWSVAEALSSIVSGAVNAIKASGNGYLFATGSYSFGKIFRSTDGGTTWQSRNIPVNSGGICLAADPGDSLTIYAGLQSNVSSTTNKVIVRSQDGGNTWTAFDVTSVLPVGFSVVSLSVDPENSQTIFAIGNSGFSDARVVASFNGGLTWEDKTGNLPYGVPYNDVTLAGGALYVAGGQLFGSQFMGVYKSIDYGVSYTDISLTFPVKVIYSVLADPLNPDNLFAGSEGDGIYISNDAGNSWDYSGSGAGESGAVRCLMITPGSSSSLFAGFLSLAVCRSQDAGLTWEFANTGIATLQVNDVEVDPADPDNVLVAFEAENSGGCYLSTDGAQSWDLVSGLPGTRFSQVTVGPDGTLYAWSNGPTTVAQEGVYKSTDGGETWINTGPDLGSVFETQIFAMTISETNPDFLLIGGNNFGLNGWESVIYRTSNGGQTWINTYLGPSADYYSIRYLSIDPNSNDQVIYAAYKSEIEGGLLKSEDGGYTWNEIGNTIPGNYKWAGAIVCDPENSLRVYAGCGGYGYSGTLYRSDDGGATWSSTSLSMGSYCKTSDILINPADPNVLYLASTMEGVMLSQDGGLTWDPASDGLTASNITGFSRVFEAGTSRRFYASTFTNSTFRTDIYPPGVGQRDPDSSGPHFTICPNPSHGSFAVTSDRLDSGEVELSIFTPLGQCLWQGKYPPGSNRNMKLNLDLKPGCYLLKVSSGGSSGIPEVLNLIIR